MSIYQGLAQQIGTTDEVTTCSCCGKSGLKATKVFKTTDDWQAEGGDEFVFLGSTCASRNYKGIKVSAKVNRKGQTDVDIQLEQEYAAVSIAAIRYLVQKAGQSAPDALNHVRHLESVPNGKVNIYKLARLYAA